MENEYYELWYLREEHRRTERVPENTRSVVIKLACTPLLNPYIAPLGGPSYTSLPLPPPAFSSSCLHGDDDVDLAATAAPSSRKGSMWHVWNGHQIGLGLRWRNLGI
ncbi:hypothetical protein CEXT_617131 [Caerostris extrusa]|uniref:Uncharacterized protein n=1 Tax=Caerostris extrusa TaxID=172846 RepID=A0AAV4XQP8_CAEEX|nr:hypothetical protein CEXT_617131 [Caerostris extrusa]